MSDTQTKFRQTYEQASNYTRSVFDDIRDSEVPQTLRRDFRETYDFYLDEAQRRELQQMGKIKRSLYSAYYLLKGLFLKLTPVRRIFLLVGVILMIDGLPTDTLQIGFSFVCVLFVLGLELKDKLLAKDELEAGRAVQLALMPAATPQVPGWDIWMHNTPANDVGGDLIDHMEVGEAYTLLTLGDVAGKGLPAALMAAKLQATVRAIAPDRASLQDLASGINRIVCRDGLPNRFASILNVEVRPGSDELHYVNAGHMPPLIVSKDGVRELERGGPAVGLSLSASFEARSVRLEPGDLMVIYSDGITEARNEIGRFFDEDRLRELIRYLHNEPAHSVGAHILQAVDDFVRGAPQSDDRSLIILRKRKATPELPA